MSNNENKSVQQKMREAILRPYKKKINYAIILSALICITAVSRFILEHFGWISDTTGTTIGFVISLPLVLAFTYFVYNIVDVLTDDRRWFFIILSCSMILVVIAEMQFIFMWLSFSVSAILFLIAGNIGLYLAYGAVDIFEIRRVQYWSIAFVLVLLTSLAVVLLPESASFPNVSVEILGAFLGVIAAIILGEILKEFEKEKQGKDLAREIETELGDIKIMLKADETEPIPYPVWTSSLMSGALMTLSSDIRRFLTLVYREIELFNHRRTKDQKEKAHYHAEIGERILKISREGLSKTYIRELMKKQVTEKIMKEKSEKESE